MTVPPQEAFLPQPPVGVARLHLNPHREVLLLTVSSRQAKLPTMVGMWSFDSIQSFGASDSLLVIQTSSQTNAKDFCCFVTSAAEEIADHLSQLVAPEENIYDTIDVESGSGDSSSSCNGSGDEAEGENHDVAAKDRSSPYRRSYLRAVGTKGVVLMDEDFQRGKTDSHMQPRPARRNTYATRGKLATSPTIRVTPDEGQSASSPTTQKRVISLAKNSPLLRRLLGSGERTPPPPEKELLPLPVGSPNDPARASPPPEEVSRPRSPFMKLKRWLSPNRLSPKIAATEFPVDSLEQGASLVDSWEEGVLDQDSTAVSPLPSPFFQRRSRRPQPVDLDFHTEHSRTTPSPPPPGRPLQWVATPPPSRAPWQWSATTERMSPALTTTAHSTMFDEASRQAEGAVADFHSVASHEEGHAPAQALPNIVPSLLPEAGEDSGALHLAGPVSQTDRIPQLSLVDDSQYTLQNETKRTKLPDWSKQSSLQVESEQPSYQDNTEQPGFQDNTEQPGLPDNVEQPGLQDNTEQPDLQDNVEQPGLQENVEQPGLQDNVEQPGLQENVEQPGLQDKIEQPGLQDKIEQPNFQDEKRSSPDPVVLDLQQVEHVKLPIQPSLFPHLMDGVDGTDGSDGTDEAFLAESVLHVTEAMSVNSTHPSSPTHRPLGRVQSDGMSAHPQLRAPPRRYSAADCEQLALRTRSGSFSELIQNIFVNSLERPGSRLSGRGLSPLSVHSHSISDDSAQVEMEVWPEMGAEFDGLAGSENRKGNSLPAVDSLTLNSNSQMTSFSLGSGQSSSEADTCSGVSGGSTYHFQGSLVRMRKVHRWTTEDSEATPSPTTAPHWVLRGRSKSASHTLPRHARSFSARPLPRAPVEPRPTVLLGSSSDYVNTAGLADSRYANMTKDLLDGSKIYDRIDLCSDLDGHYATLDFAALQPLQDGSRSAAKPPPASGGEKCIYAQVDIRAMEAARRLADQRRREREVHSQGQPCSAEGEQRRRHGSEANTMQAGVSGRHRRLRTWSSVGTVGRDRKTFTE